MNATLQRHANADAAYRAAADAFVAQANTAIKARGRFVVALAGGNTPRPLYALLANAPYRDALDWSRVHVCFGDERCVPPDSLRSNYRMAREALLDAVSLPAANVHRMQGENDPAHAALAYKQTLQSLFRHVGVPRFDLVLLGVGDNGHVASLFPGTGALRERRHAVCAQYVEVQNEWRLTLTRPVLDAAEAVWMLVLGKEKAAIVQRVLQGPFQPDVLPAQYVAGATWWLDAAASALLQDNAAVPTPR